ncbi:MAG: putative lipid II flippase FtsW [Christensenella sp.]|nr:putative lipid II flippase FtsW [Christensenella sp.]
MIYSASYYSAKIYYNDSFFFLKKQAISLLSAIICFFISKNIQLEFWRKNAIVLYVISIILLVMVFIPKIGVENYGARRWINLFGISFQPSELAKYALVLMISSLIHKIDNPGKRFVLIALVSLIVVVLILLEPNMSIAITISFVVLIMIIFGGLKLKYLLLLLIPVIAFGVVLVLMEPYRLARLSAFIDPWKSPQNEGYQLIQSFYALAGGGLFGVGLFNSRQKYLFLPFAESDFIFSIICEEFGFVGGLIIIALFIAVFIEGLLIAKQASTKFEAFLSIGIISVIIVQALLNVAVVTGSIPPTGLPLPFVSYGGTSICVIYFFIGMLDVIKKNSLQNKCLNKIY